MKFCSLFSGSSGNATYIGDEHSGILIDIGKNMKQVVLSLAAIGVPPEAVKAIFITHEHSDHISGLRVFCNKYHVPVYASNGTLSYLDDHGHLNGDFTPFIISGGADIEDFHIECFHTMHDAAESLCYTIMLPDYTKVAVATDLGVVTPEVLDGITGARAILLESNHDIGMLSNGPYPYPLKRRILSDIGHLSNDACADTALELLKSGTEHFMLGHLSNENNVPQLAYQTTLSKLQVNGAILDTDYTLDVANRNEITKLEI